jgi:hypothetical protein
MSDNAAKGLYHNPAAIFVHQHKGDSRPELRRHHFCSLIKFLWKHRATAKETRNRKINTQAAEIELEKAGQNKTKTDTSPMARIACFHFSPDKTLSSDPMQSSKSRKQASA